LFQNAPKSFVRKPPIGTLSRDSHRPNTLGPKYPMLQPLLVPKYPMLKLGKTPKKTIVKLERGNKRAQEKRVISP
jgi:hypothetical protein